MAGVLLEAVSKVYPAGRLAVDDVTLRIGDGEFFALLGPAGSGKSTLLRMIAGLEDPTSGKLWLGDRLANDLPSDARGVELLTGPVPPRTPGAEPGVLLLDRLRPDPDADRAVGALDDLGALIRRPGVTTVYATDDQVEALTLADRIGVMRDGRLEDSGTPSQLYDDPATAFVAGHLGVPGTNLLAAAVRAVPGEGVVLLLGGQRLTVPWSDPRAASIAGHDGAPVIVGVRPDALRPTGDPHNGPVLSGHVRALDYHGYEWLARVDAGLSPAEPVPAARRKPLAAVGIRSRATCTGRALAALRGRCSAASGRRDERAELLVRLPVGHGRQAGGVIHLAVDLDRVLVFDRAGHRVDPVRR